ncbi:hypothetical protein GCM10010191_47810 [Actinomadura vinacea]|uniref:Phage tail protein n=1 Tax=Actinomadura vinacea TaxID=115336 RepID=A0ABN3JFP6_9ACTN
MKPTSELAQFVVFGNDKRELIAVAKATAARWYGSGVKVKLDIIASLAGDAPAADGKIWKAVTVASPKDPMDHVSKDNEIWLTMSGFFVKERSEVADRVAPIAKRFFVDGYRIDGFTAVLEGSTDGTDGECWRVSGIKIIEEPVLSAWWHAAPRP